MCVDSLEVRPPSVRTVARRHSATLPHFSHAIRSKRGLITSARSLNNSCNAQNGYRKVVFVCGAIQQRTGGPTPNSLPLPQVIPCFVPLSPILCRCHGFFVDAGDTCRIQSSLFSFFCGRILPLRRRAHSGTFACKGKAGACYNGGSQSWDLKVFSLEHWRHRRGTFPPWRLRTFFFFLFFRF